ncbi:hypothetical protein JCM30760_26860 [Thiomicrorhabdus hydrogeniphila]
MFIEKGVVHPTVEFIREKYDITWKELGSILQDRMATMGYELKLSPSNVRNFATSQSVAWWFWPRISEIVLGFWEQERQQSTTIEEKTNADLEFSGLFSEDLRAVYALWYAILEDDSFDRINSKTIRPCIVITNALLRDCEAFFGCEFPRIQEFEEFNKSCLLVSE